MSDKPTNSRELDVTHNLSFSECDVGDEVWVNASMIRGNKFRAVKVEVKDRVSVNHFEEMHAIDKWPKKDRMKTSHEIAEGI